MKVDILFSAKHRKEYTQESLRQLRLNTDWRWVKSVWLYNDGYYQESPRTTEKLFEEFMVELPPDAYVSVNVVRSNFGSPVAIMNDYFRRGEAAWFAKIDNDTVVPPGWLDACVLVAETENTDLIGIECRDGYTKYPPMPLYGPSLKACGAAIVGQHSVSWPDKRDGKREPKPFPIVRYRSTDHIGGIGLFRHEVFTTHPLPRPNRTYYGFTEWQWEFADVRKCWIDPPLPVVLLDHVGEEPWSGLGREYVKKGWQRASWGMYKDKSGYEWWLETL